VHVAAKQKKIFICQQCGYQSGKWVGKCPECDQWNSFQEEVREVSRNKPVIAHTSKPVRLLEGEDAQMERVDTRIPELNRVLGGGIVPGAVALVGGDPGIGKSTLMLQLLQTVQATGPLLYVSGEESQRQVKLRAQRMGITNKDILFSQETNIEALLQILDEHQPELVIVDSIQTMYSSDVDSLPGNISQLRACSSLLLRHAKTNAVAVFLIGHVTKEGAIAGPRVLEHLVDTVLYFEGERQYDYRILRSVKNRFGPVNEIGIFRMTGIGLEAVANPSELFLPDEGENNSGNAVVVLVEGNRPFLVQVQALVAKTQFGTPQRTATGIDHRRMNLLLAVLEKRCGKPFGFHDVFLKAAGGLRLDEPATDLGICMALASGIDDVALPEGTIYIGEVGLSGEIRPVNRLQERIQEAVQLGYSNIVIPASARIKSPDGNVHIRKARNLYELL
jgi:DNA repair protein RadA/Sms